MMWFKTHSLRHTPNNTWKFHTFVQNCPSDFIDEDLVLNKHPTELPSNSYKQSQEQTMLRPDRFPSLQDDPTDWLLKPFPVEYEIAVGGFRKKLELEPVPEPSYMHRFREFRKRVAGLGYIPSQNKLLFNFLATLAPLFQSPSDKSQPVRCSAHLTYEIFVCALSCTKTPPKGQDSVLQGPSVS
jgi:hypothetical protein